MKFYSINTFFIAIVTAVLAIALTTTAQAQSEHPLLVNGDLSTWQYQSFDDIAETDYQTKFDSELQSSVVFANSQQGASGYIKETLIDLSKTPWLHFRWRVDEASGTRNERKKSGDDFAFRIYFAGRDGVQYKSLSLTRSLSPSGTHWQNPYAGFINDLRTYAVIGGDEPLQQWQSKHVNLQEIWRKLFDDNPPILGLVGIMTDSDSSSTIMRARYGDIILSDSENSPF